MPTAVHVNTYTHTTTHVATNLVRSLKQIVVGCGLDASKLVGCWQTIERGVATWLGSRHLRRVILEIYEVRSSGLVTRFDFDIDYGYHPAGDGALWLDPETVAYGIRKAGAVPATCNYDVLVETAPGHPAVSGWTEGTLRSTADLHRRSVGSAVGGGSLGASLSYWR